MFRTSDHSVRRAGFSLTELIIAMSIAAVVGVAVISAYLFLGRNLTRSLNTQRQEVEGRRTVEQFTRDLSAVEEVRSATSTSLSLRMVISVRDAGGNEVPVRIGADYFRAADGALKRETYNVTATPPFERTTARSTQTLASGVSAHQFTYFNEGGTVVTARQSIKSVELSFTSVLGSSGAGTLTRSTTVSPRVVLRNQQPLR